MYILDNKESTFKSTEISTTALTEQQQAAITKGHVPIFDGEHLALGVKISTYPDKLIFINDPRDIWTIQYLEMKPEYAFYRLEDFSPAWGYVSDPENYRANRRTAPGSERSPYGSTPENIQLARYLYHKVPGANLTKSQQIFGVLTAEEKAADEQEDERFNISKKIYAEWWLTKQHVTGPYTAQEVYQQAYTAHKERHSTARCSVFNEAPKRNDTSDSSSKTSSTSPLYCNPLG